MKSLFFALIFLCSFPVFVFGQTDSLSNDSIENLVKDIRKKYRYINVNKAKYELEEKEYDSEADDMANGNDNIDNLVKTRKYLQGKKLYLVEVDSLTHIYPIIGFVEILTHYELYFWNNQLFFFYQRAISKPMRPQDIQNDENYFFANEQRVYFFNGEPIRYLEKKIEGRQMYSDNEVEKIFSSMPNKSVSLKMINNNALRGYLMK